MAVPSGAAALADIPAVKPPPGVIPDFAHPYTDGPVLIAVGAVFTALALLFVFARIHTKIKVVRKWSPDDTTCIIGAIGTVCYYIAAVVGVTIGRAGTHMWDLRLSDLSSDASAFSGFFTNWPTLIIWTFIKLTFFLMYIQIFRPFKWLRYGSYAGAIVTVLFYFSILVATLAWTVPNPGQTLAESLQNPREARATNITIPTGCVSLVLDVYILLLPITGVGKLQLPLRRKVGVMAVFFTGFVACIASSIGLYYRVLLKRNLADYKFETMPVILFSIVEMCVGIIASSMPAVSGYFRQVSSLGHWGSKLTSRFHHSSWFSSNKGVSSDSGLTYGKRKRTLYTEVNRSGSASKDHTYAMAPVKSIRTFVHAGTDREVEEDGIHLQYQVEQRIVANGNGHV